MLNLIVIASLLIISPSEFISFGLTLIIYFNKKNEIWRLSFVGKISINIVVYEGKKLWDGDGLVEIIRGG